MRYGVLGVPIGLLTLVFWAGAAHAGTQPVITAAEAYVIDATDGTVPYAKREHRRVPVASLTKIMTAYVVRQEARLGDALTITTADVRHANASGATTAGLKAGERVSVRELLYALLLPSGADAAHALAERYGPGTSKFVAKMNAAARELGLNDTRFTNPDGLPGKGYSSAADQASLAQVALDDSVLRQVVKAGKHTYRKHVWRNTNKLLSEGALGLKTGYTTAAGFCLSFAEKRHGHLFIGVVLGETSDARRFTTARKLLSYAEGWSSET
ncbi:D-alanyl-D-alanine carboxypeptidase [Streptosporangiaceae bacterium NEAU-GS5]|nr:D-alanyl-D-alanine carboxypeptidase [Streptosporangiaceae bacterium NEAU-GS5]